MRKFIFTFLCCAFICDSYAQSKLSEVKVDPNLEKTIMNFVEADAARRKAEQQKQQQTEERHDTQRREQTHQFNKKMEHLNNTTAENYFNGPSTGQQTNTNQQTSFTATKYQDIQNEDVKNILVLRNAFEKTRKQMKVNTLSINALSDNLNFPMFAKLTLKKT